MFLKLVHLTLPRLPRSHCRVFSSQKTTATMLLPAYIQHQEGEEHFKLFFHLKSEVININKQLMFSRKVDEKVSEFITRINMKILTKKKKKKRKGETDLEGDPQLNIELWESNAKIDENRTFQEIFASREKIYLKILDIQYLLNINTPMVETLALPNSIMANFPAYPSKFEAKFTNVDQSEFIWSKSETIEKAPNPRILANWVETGTGFVYTPSNQEIGCHLKVTCIPKNDEQTGPKYEMFSQSPVEAGPGPCPFETRHQFTKERLTGNKFRVMSYNILADLYAETEVACTQLYPYCAPYALGLDYRKQLLCKEILGYNADIMCMQEVDSKVFDLDLIPVLSKTGAQGVFSRKGNVSEGLACIFQPNRFKLLDSKSITLAEEIQSNSLYSEVWNQIQNNEAFKDRFVARTTSLQIVIFESVDNKDHILIIGNTHLYFHPNSDHIRLLQGGMCILYLENEAKEFKKKFPEKQVSIIFCGDFNSTPDCGVYRLMTTGEVDQNNLDWQSMPEQQVNGVGFKHNVPLKSACGTPKHTNFTAGFSGCLDYIYYQTDKIEVSQVVPLPSDEELVQHTALPSIVFPSDHLALVADLTWT